MCREELCNAISVACQLRKKAAAAEIGRLGVWTNHVKISVVASENALQPNEPSALQVIRTHSDWGMATAWSARWWLGGGSNRLHHPG